eukprot:4730082-Amphidinium_carterae.1
MGGNCQKFLVQLCFGARVRQVTPAEFAHLCDLEAEVQRAPTLDDQHGGRVFYHAKKSGNGTRTADSCY